jgi:hypothetical protein
LAQKPTAPRVISGTHGFLYWDGELIFEVSSFEAKIKPNRETVTFAGDMVSDSKLMGVEGEFTFKLKKVFSRGQIKLAKEFKAGRDPRSQLIGKLADPDAYGSERLVLDNCWFNDVTLMAFESGKMAEDEFGGGFTDWDFPDVIKPR